MDDCEPTAFSLEWWAGRKGVVILQIWDDPPGGGVSTYADWPLGATMGQLKDAL